MAARYSWKDIFARPARARADGASSTPTWHMVVLRRRGARSAAAIETRPVDFVTTLKRHGVRLSKGRDALERLLAKQPR